MYGYELREEWSSPSGEVCLNLSNRNRFISEKQLYSCVVYIFQYAFIKQHPFWKNNTGDFCGISKLEASCTSMVYDGMYVCIYVELVKYVYPIGCNVIVCGLSSIAKLQTKYIYNTSKPVLVYVTLKDQKTVTMRRRRFPIQWASRSHI